jgi:Ribosomal protein L11 methyltransferase (PrmA)
LGRESEEVPHLTEIALSPDTILQLAPNFRTRLDAAGHVVVDSPAGTVVDIGPRGFAILSMFSRPVTLGDALDRLEAEFGGSTEFAPTMSVVNMLIEENTLIASGGRAPTSGWADPIEHARMLHDDRRTCDFISALTAAVRPGDVVLDIGTGSGVLAVALARAGAGRVYAVEASDIAAVAARVFEANGVTDRVTLVPGWSRQIELPERADLLVAEIIGNEPLEEEILETTLDARRHLLKPGARLVPHALELLARPLLLPEADIRQRVFGRAAMKRWQDLYGIDFHPLLDVAAKHPAYSTAEGEVAATWPPVGPPVVLASVDLTTFREASVRGRACTTASRTHSTHGSGRRRVGRRRSGRSPSRPMSARDPRCARTTIAASPASRTGSPSRSSTVALAEQAPGQDHRLLGISRTAHRIARFG